MPAPTTHALNSPQNGAMNTSPLLSAISWLPVGVIKRRSNEPRSSTLLLPLLLITVHAGKPLVHELPK